MARVGEASLTLILLVATASTPGLAPNGAAAAPARTRVGTHGPASGISLTCDDCHTLHAAPGSWGSAGSPGEDWSCLDCHGSRRRAVTRRTASGSPGGVSAASLKAHDLEAEFRKPSGHPLVANDRQPLRRPARTTGFPRVAADLVEGDRREGTACIDCHDPHASSGPGAPLGSGPLDEHLFRDARGQSITEEAFCFGCHGSARNLDLAAVSVETLLQPDNPSAHPMAGAPPGGTLPGLLPGAAMGAGMGCSDCHGNDDDSGPRGPHGSLHSPLLKARYNQEDGRPESPAEYALCYGCHDRHTLLSPLSGFPLHASHVVDAGASCSACHDAHGSVRHEHLLDFDDSVVKPNSLGRLDFDESRTVGASCNLSCHDKDHVDSTY